MLWRNIVTIAHASRFTTLVNHDLHIDQQENPGILLSALVTVTGCDGLVVEHPMYFNFNGINSGSDVIGATATSTTSYFADIPTSTGSSSFVTTFLSILNPPSGSTATITARYYAAGAQVGSQSILVAPGSRGTLKPGSLSLPAHVGAIITSNHPVVVERAIYRHDMPAGVVGMVSSASTVMAVTALANHWMFAEGYTNARSQENLLLTNLSSSSTTATITLEYQNTRHQTITQVVKAHSQVVLNINQLNAHPTGVCDSSPCAPTPEVSADITATSSSLLVERQMYFRYSHTLPSTQINLAATGGTDVVGATTAATTTANFAEGYTNVGYNEWLTLQNPTQNEETLVLTLRNEYGHTYNQDIHVYGKSRSTVDITALVREQLVQAGNDSRAYQVSMSVKSTGGAPFVAERPMYFNPNTLGIQGGTDVIGFSASPPICAELDTSLSSGFGYIIAGPDGNIWATELTTNMIARITPAGVKTEYTVPTADSEPLGITTGPDHNLWFTELQTSKIGRITTAGVFTEYVVPTPDSHPLAITAGPDGNLWFIENSTSKIGRITTAGVFTEYNTTFPTNSLFLSIAPGPDGNVWFPEVAANKIGRITPPGVITEFSTGITPNSSPLAIITGPDGNLWFTEPGAAKVAYITTAGVVTEINIGPNTNPADIILGPDNNIWFTDLHSGKLGRCLVIY